MKTGAVVAVALLAASCGGGTDAEVIVSAAASLAGPFEEIAAAFESANPGVDVVLNAGSSSLLRTQIIEGAPVDVYAAADEFNMDRVEEAGLLAAERAIFASNEMQIGVPADNPAGIGSIADFARRDLLIGLCAEGVPCGDLAREVLRSAGIEAAADTYEPDVRALLTKIEAGELDAGIVYRSDIAAPVEGVEIDSEHNASTEYPVAVLSSGGSPQLGERFVEFLLSEEGRSVLVDFGFGVP